MAASKNEEKGWSDDVGMGMKMTMRMIRTKFPSVKQIQTDDLDKLLNSSYEKSNVILLDVRDLKEYNVSHLKDAHLIDTNIKNVTGEVLALVNKQVSNTDDPKTVVAYCSVGYRSSSLIQDLMKELKKPEHIQCQNSLKLYNLEGSIFKWANEGRAIVNCDGCNVFAVHPYNFVWGKLLNSELVKYGEDS